MITFGITGSICVGKSLITNIFRQNDIPIIDADIVAKQLMEPGAIGYREIIAHFGNVYLKKDLSINRKKFANLIWHNTQAREELNKIMFPLISNASKLQINDLHNQFPIIGFDSALLIESGDADNFRPLIVVCCNDEIQIKRLMKRNSLTYHEAVTRISCQLPQKKKIRYADIMIDTDDSIEEITKTVIDIISTLRKLDDGFGTRTNI